jgi:hypothetical protein
MLREPKKPSSRYHIFILSLWEEGGAFPGATSWRFSLEQAQGAGRKGFGSLPELTAFLAAWIQRSPDEASGAQDLPAADSW